MVLTKARLTLLVVVTIFVGFLMASTVSIDWILLLHTLLGASLVAGASSVLNQAMEIRQDTLMVRTQDRPLPAERIPPKIAIWLGLILGVSGVVYLYLAVNPLAAFLSFLTWALYILVYTPLKLKTSLCTFVGAIPGALPPMIGWAAVQGKLELGAWILFSLLFFWQLPHFFAISWIYKEDFSRAGFKMLAVQDETGDKVSRYALAFTSCLIATSLLPSFLKTSNPFYFYGALLLGFLFLITGFQFALEKSVKKARILFFASIIYLPAILGLMVFTKS